MHEGAMYSVDFIDRTFSFVTLKGPYTGDLLTVTSVEYTPSRLSDSTWIHIGKVHNDSDVWDAFRVAPNPVWNKFVSTMTDAISLRKECPMDTGDILVVGARFRSTDSPHIFEINEMTEDSVKLLNTATDRMYDIPLVMLRGRGNLLSFSYRFSI